MKLLWIALTIAVWSTAQPASGPFTGSWMAVFEGRTFIGLDIKTVDGTLVGDMNVGNFEVDQLGLVSRADAAPPMPTPISGVTRKGSTVTFTRKDGRDTDQFEMRLRENGDADLHFLLNDDDRRELASIGVPAPKPIRLTKATL